MTYSPRIVVFLDILGFSNAVMAAAGNPGRQGELYSLIDELRRFFLRPEQEVTRGQQYNIDTQVLQGSDSLVISINPDQSAGIYHLLRECSFACHLVIRHGFLLRGYITIGDLIHDRGILFGPSFIEAYKQETLEALPIIKFNYSQFAEMARTFPGNANIGFEETEINFINNHCCQLDGDTYYVDYFNDYPELAANSMEDVINQYTILKNLIQDSLSGGPNLVVLYKMLWARDRFNKSKIVLSKSITRIEFRVSPTRYMLAFIMVKLKQLIKKMFI